MITLNLAIMLIRRCCLLLAPHPGRMTAPVIIPEGWDGCLMLARECRTNRCEDRPLFWAGIEHHVPETA